jgi:hypothetical protein
MLCNDATQWQYVVVFVMKFSLVIKFDVMHRG